MYRVFPDGSPSWEIVKNNILKFQRDYELFGTKITLGPDTLKYIFDATVFCFEELNMTDVNMNVVFEDLWGDRLGECLEIFEEQLSKLYDYLVTTERWRTNYVGILGVRNIPMSQIEKLYGEESHLTNKIFCGAAAMRSIDSDGSIYPCFRLSPYSLNGDRRYQLEGDSENRRSLLGINTFDSANDECFNCPLLTACPMCVGGAIEESDSIYYRTTHHCEFMKIQYKWSLKLFNHLNPEHQLENLIHDS
jgi:radical SAM protein with 4Fe4S-binding SPASM domain